MKGAMRGAIRWRSVVRSHPTVDFTDTKKAYHLKSFSELLRHYLLYKIFGFKSLVRHSNKVSGPTMCSHYTPYM